MAGPAILLLWTTAASCDAGARPSTAREPAPETAATAIDDASREAADKHCGAYAFSGGQSERDAVLAAIDDVVAEMNPLARGIARERLRDANPVPARIEIAREADMLAIAFDGRRYEASLDGSKTQVEGITGDTLDYHVTVSAARIRQTFTGPKGGRKNLLGRKGEHGLSVDVTVTSDSLPKPLAYRLSFKRSE